jgi:hypothetical protein
MCAKCPAIAVGSLWTFSGSTRQKCSPFRIRRWGTKSPVWRVSAVTRKWNCYFTSNWLKEPNSPSNPIDKPLFLFQHLNLNATLAVVIVLFVPFWIHDMSQSGLSGSLTCTHDALCHSQFISVWIVLTGSCWLQLNYSFNFMIKGDWILAVIHGKGCNAHLIRQNNSGSHTCARSWLPPQGSAKTDFNLAYRPIMERRWKWSIIFFCEKVKHKLVLYSAGELIPALSTTVWTMEQEVETSSGQKTALFQADKALGRQKINGSSIQF